MSGLRLRLKSAPAGRLDLSCLHPVPLTAYSADEAARLPFEDGALGDLFEISSIPESDTLVLAGPTAACDGIGDGLKSGTLVVEGDAGQYAGRFMRGGRLDIKGSAGGYLGAGMKGGLITVAGSAGNFVGGLLPGEKFGMAGGFIRVGGDIGERAGDRMRRGTIVVKGKTGAAAGSRMAGGTIWAEGGFGPGAGPLMRRGTLIGPKADQMLATFSDCGEQDMVFLRLISRFVAAELGGLAPPALPAKVRRYAGDMATIGKGELLLTG
jgi:formylmethanofuran dehydrogenase subunit C